MASLVALRLLGMAADRGLPATRPTMSGLAPSLTAAGPGRSTVSAQHHAAAARRLTGPSLCPCDEPSTQSYDSLAVPTPERRRTPADADRGAEHHMSNGPSRDKSGTSEDPPPPTASDLLS